jgi:hypothetical protein
MQQYFFITLLSFSNLFNSFRDIPTSPEKAITGTYGVCSCEAAGNTQVKLSLNEDLTFHYIDKSDRSNPKDITGKWKLDKNVVRLSATAPGINIHDKWKIDANGLCMKSRKGLTYYRLCNLRDCK